MKVSMTQAIELLKQGDVLAYPTEAVWGLGCDPYQQAAFEKILHLKQRPIEKGVILVAANIEQAMPFLGGLTEQQLKPLLDSWQPAQAKQRATTWLVPLTAAVPPWIHGQHDQVAIRVSQHPLVQALCTGLGQVLVSTSANPSSLAAAKTADEVQSYFPNLAYLDGETDQQSQPSRIIDAVTGTIIRA